MNPEEKKKYEDMAKASNEKTKQAHEEFLKSRNITENELLELLKES
jgi:hypothetical protein